MGSSLLLRMTAGAAVAACLLAMPVGSDLSAQTPTFRTGIAVVPIDVRVVDRKGNPINDLTKDDFIVQEDGVRQTITHFERQSMTPGVRSAESSLLVPGLPAPASIKLQNRRVFYIALGQAWLPNALFDLVPAVTKFLRERLLPQDYAVVSAFGHMTDLTSDHEALAQVVERIAALQRSIDASPDRFRLTVDMYGNRRLPPDSATRRSIDAAFSVASTVPHLTSRASRPEFDAILDQLEGHATTIALGAPPNPSPRAAGARAAAAEALKEQLRGLTSQALSLMNAIQYLRFIDGEKHLVHFSRVPAAAVEDDRSLGRLASDARVAIHFIHANGISRSGGFESMLDEMAAKNVAEFTGGQTFFNKYPDEALARIDAVTRVGYLLAYSPLKAEADGRHRKISIKVTRPGGATVMARQSYLATDKPRDYDEQQFAVQDRVMAVAEAAGGIPDLGVKVKADWKGKTVDVDVQVDFTQVKATPDDDRHAAKLEVVVFCTNAQRESVGQKWMTLDMKLKDETFARALKEGFHHAASVPVTGAVSSVKVVVYDYATGRAGSAVVRVR